MESENKTSRSALPSTAKQKARALRHSPAAPEDPSPSAGFYNFSAWVRRQKTGGGIDAEIWKSFVKMQSTVSRRRALSPEPPVEFWIGL